MKTINYKIEGHNVNYRIEFLTNNKLRYYNGGDKNYPRTTQCLVYYNGLLHSTGEVVKHHLDSDNLNYAIRASAKKALKKVYGKDVRKDIWNQILEQTK